MFTTTTTTTDRLCSFYFVANEMRCFLLEAAYEFIITSCPGGILFGGVKVHEIHV